MRKHRKKFISMDIFTIQTIRQNIQRSSALMHSVKENIKAAIVMSILGGLLVAICGYLYIETPNMSTESFIFILIHFIGGIGALVFAIVMIVNSVIDFRRAEQRINSAYSEMWRMEERLSRKTA